MKVFRFMSELEFIRYMNNETMINNTDHSEMNNCTSKGFCFLDLDEYKPEEAFHFLFGIVSPEICAIFDVEEDRLKETSGVYSNNSVDYDSDKPFFLAKEYCTNFYSSKDVKLVKYCRPVWTSYNWNWIGGEW